MMKKNVKAFSLLLVFLLFAMMALASGSSDKGSSAPESSGTVTPDQTEKESLTETPDTKKSETSDAKENSTEGTGKTSEKATESVTEKAPETSSEKAAETYTLQDVTLIDSEFCTVKIVKAEADLIWGFQLKVFCENKTEDKNLMFSVDDVSVNGYMMDPFWADSAAPGKKTNSDMSFGTSSFKECGIETADEISFILRVHDADDWMAENYHNEPFTLYPTGKTQAEITYPERRTATSEKVIVDNDALTFVILESEDDSIWGYSLNCYLENKSDKSLTFSVDDVSVNGFMIDPFWASTVLPGKRNYSSMSFSDSEFEENGIEEVEKVEFTLRVYDANNWFDEDVLKETFSYEP